MDGQALHVAGLLVRRLAHDLAGPVAAVSTLAGMGERDPLLDGAAAELTRRLELARSIFAGLPDAPIDSAHASARLAEAAGPGAHVEARLAADAPPARVRAALALALDLLPLLAEGGRLCLDVAATGALEVEAGPLRAPLPSGWRETVLAGARGARPLEPGLVPTAVAAMLAGPFSVSNERGGIHITAPSA